MYQTPYDKSGSPDSGVNVEGRPAPRRQHNYAKMMPKMSKETERWLLTIRSAEYASILLSNPLEVSSWQERYGYNDRQISWILQDFEQVGLVRGMDRIKSILEKRQAVIRRDGGFDELDELDPLRKFPETGLSPRGVPEEGFVLDIDHDLPLHDYGDDVTQGHKAKQAIKGDIDKHYQILGFPKVFELIPVGKTLTQIVHEYPNHTQYQFVDAFMQHRISANSIVEQMTADMRKAFQSAGCFCGRATGGRQQENLFQKRYGSRRDQLLVEYGADVTHDYFNSPFKIREVGEVGVFKFGSSYHDVKSYLQGQQEKGRVAKGPENANRRGKQQRGSRTAAHVQGPLPPSLPPSQAQKLGKQAARSSPQELSTAGTQRQSSQLPPAPNFSIELSAEHPLGSFQNIHFWLSTYEYDQHLSQAIDLYEKCKQLAFWCIWHDNVSHNDHRTIQTTKARALVAYLFQMQCNDLYGESWQQIAIPHGVSYPTISSSNSSSWMLLAVWRCFVLGNKRRSWRSGSRSEL